MSRIQTIDHNQADWDKIFNANFAAIGNGEDTFSDTGYITDGITLLNGAQKYSDFAGDVPGYRIVQLGSVNILMVTGSFKGITANAGSVLIKYASFPAAVLDWFNKHQTMNNHYATSIFVNRYSWLFQDNYLILQSTVTSVNAGDWLSFNHVFIA